MLAVLTMAVAVSCQKEKNDETPKTQKESSSKGAVERIIEFKNKLETHRKHPSERTGSTIRLEDAVWYMENVFNATYSQPDVVCSATSEFEFCLYLPVDVDGNVSEIDLLDFYDLAVAHAREAYANDGFTDKVFKIMLVNADHPTDGIARLHFKGRTGERITDPHIPGHDTVSYWGPFNIDDDYHYDYGKCDGTGIDGADEMLTYHVGLYIASQLATPPTGTRAIYINTTEVILHGFDYQNDLFYRTDANATCIDFNNMNRLYNTEKTLVTVTLPGNPLGNVYGMTPVDLLVFAENSVFPQYIAHGNLVFYAQRLIASLNEVGDVENLLNN